MKEQFQEFLTRERKKASYRVKRTVREVNTRKEVNGSINIFGGDKSSLNEERTKVSQ